MNFKEILYNTLSVQSHSRNTERMNAYIKRFVKKIPGAVMHIDSGNIYVMKGKTEIYPCLVAHTDTVHAIRENFVVLKHEGTYFGWNKETQVGVGGDDKVGIAMCLWFLQELPAVKVAFFRDEELGCIGSGLGLVEFFDNVSFVVQCDRKGYSDVVSTIMGVTLMDGEFKEKVTEIAKDYDKSLTQGMMTDVWKLRKKGMKVQSMNLSCGYWSPHSSQEIVVEEDVERTRDFITDMIDQLGHQQWLVNDTTPTVTSPYGFQPAVMHDNAYQSNLYELYGAEEEDEDAFTSNFFEDTPSDYSEVEERCYECGESALVYEFDPDTGGKTFCLSCQAYVEAFYSPADITESEVMIAD